MTIDVDQRALSVAQAFSLWLFRPKPNGDRRLCPKARTHPRISSPKLVAAWTQRACPQINHSRFQSNPARESLCEYSRHRTARVSKRMPFGAATVALRPHPLNWRILGLALCIAAFALLPGCGYHVGGQADLIPKSVKSICIPPFKNRTKYYRLIDTLPNAISREFKARTKFVIVNDPEQADAILAGEVTNVLVVPSIYDPQTGTASAAFVIAYMNVTLSERVSKKVLYSKVGLECRDNYEIAQTPSKYFDESDFAVNRLSKKIASQVVDAVVEAF